MNNISRIAIAVSFLIVLLVIYFYSLSLYPIPWFDETFIASISKDFMERGHFFPFISPIALKSHECYTYGPVFPIIQSVSFLLFGFGSYAARLPGLIFGIIMCFLLTKLFLSGKKNAGWLGFFLTAGLLIDYTIFENIHSGRMETLAMTFVLISSLLVLNNTIPGISRKRFFMVLIYSICAALAVLTTPRSAVLLPPIIIVFIAKQFAFRKRELLIELTIFSFTIFCFLTTWIYYAFGGFSQMLDYYKIVETTTDFWKGFSFRESIYIYQYPAIIASLVLALVSLLLNGKKFFDTINCLSFISIILFYAVVTIYRQHAIYTMVYFYLLGINSLYQIINYEPKRQLPFSARLVLVVWFLSMFIAFGLKAFYITKSSNERHADRINAFVKNNIPPGSKVVGDDAYYFAVINAGSDFQFSQHFRNDTIREAYHRGQYDYDYLLISAEKDLYHRFIFDLYSRESKLQLVAGFNPSVSEITTSLRAKRPGLVALGLYNGILYHRVKRDP